MCWSAPSESERGSTSLADVQEAAGVGASQVYHYFEDKQALVRVVVEHQTDAILDAQSERLDHLDTVAGLRAWRDALVDLQRQRNYEGGCPIGSMVSELADDWPEARADLAAGFARWEAAIRDGLRAMHARGELAAGADPDAEELREHVRKSLRGSRTPDRVVFRDELPTNATGKVLRREIVEELRAAPAEQ